jgi:hypothetical protein
MKHGAVFGAIDLLAPKHGIDPHAQPGFLRQSQEDLDRFIGNAVLGAIEVNACRFGRHACATPQVSSKEFSEILLADLPGVNTSVRQLSPCRTHP